MPQEADAGVVPDALPSCKNLQRNNVSSGLGYLRELWQLVAAIDPRALTEGDVVGLDFENIADA